jgi:hypothetical protein
MGHYRLEKGRTGTTSSDRRAEALNRRDEVLAEWAEIVSELKSLCGAGGLSNKNGPNLRHSWIGASRNRTANVALRNTLPAS